MQLHKFVYSDAAITDNTTEYHHHNQSALLNKCKARVVGYSNVANLHVFIIYVANTWLSLYNNLLFLPAYIHTYVRSCSDLKLLALLGELFFILSSSFHCWFSL